MEEKNVFFQLSKWCIHFGAFYNMDFNGSCYSFAIRLMDCRTLSSAELIELMSIFEDTKDNWYTIVSFEANCIRITYDRKNV